MKVSNALHIFFAAMAISTSKAESESTSKGKKAMPSEQPTPMPTRAPISDPYDFLQFIIMEGICMAVPVEQSLVCARDVGFASYGIKLSFHTPTDFMTYCCKDFYDHINLAVMANRSDCRLDTFQACIPDTTNNDDRVFFPQETISNTETNPSGVCCDLVYPTM